MLDTWFSRIKVMRALDQEMGGARQGREGIRGWNLRSGVDYNLIAKEREVKSQPVTD